MSKEKIESSLDLYIARNIFRKKNVQLVKCYYAPDDGSVTVIGDVKDCTPNKKMFGMDTNFDYPAYQHEEDFPLVEEFYENYLCLDPEDSIAKKSFMRKAKTYDSIHAYCFTPLSRYSKCNDLMNEAIKEAIKLNLITKDTFMAEIKNITGIDNTFDFMTCSSFDKAKALYYAVVNKKFKSPTLSIAI